MKFFKGDLHIHTCLSPCGSLDMSPMNIINKIKEENLEIIAICDHNTMENLKPTINLGLKNGILVIPGIEITSEEEVHILGLFSDLDKAFQFQEFIYENLDNLENKKFIEEQVIVDEEENVLGFCSKSLFTATKLKINEIVERIHFFKGIAIASHIDREAFSIIGQLGFIPEGIPLDGLEIAFDFKEDYLNYNLPLIRTSDAHFLEDIGKKYTNFYIEYPSFEEVLMAFKKEKGRFLEI